MRPQFPQLPTAAKAIISCAANRTILPNRKKACPARMKVLLLLAIVAPVFTGCEVIDPDWQARQDGLARSPEPPQQWDPGFGHEDRQTREYEREYGNQWP